jgi:hypothetical protein
MGTANSNLIDRKPLGTLDKLTTVKQVKEQCRNTLPVVARACGFSACAAESIVTQRNQKCKPVSRAAALLKLNG